MVNALCQTEWNLNYRHMYCSSLLLFFLHSWQQQMEQCHGVTVSSISQRTCHLCILIYVAQTNLSQQRSWTRSSPVYVKTLMSGSSMLSTLSSWYVSAAAVNNVNYGSVLLLGDALIKKAATLFLTTRQSGVMSISVPSQARERKERKIELSLQWAIVGGSDIYKLYQIW